MRRNIVHIGADELRYEIRGIAELARKVAAVSGKPVHWENIGDPVQKGELIPQWIKDIVAEAVQDDLSYGYCPTRGLLETREFLANQLNQRGGVQITPDDILFFNGLGDGVHKIYGLLRRDARVIGPSPSYPTHSSAEASHAGSAPITYRLMPEDGWRPDMEELHNKVKYNEAIAGIMLINPDNPTGAVYPPEVVERMVALARDYDLFIVADEIYANLVHNGTDYKPLSDIIGDVAAISLKGISKEVPWPGSRCGWMEVYNQRNRPMFRRYVRSILDSKMLEVCSTTLPQKVIPAIFGDARYEAWQNERRAFFARGARRAEEILSDVRGIIVNRPQGAFYLTVVFNAALNDRMRLYMENQQVEDLVAPLCQKGIEGDRRFVYQLLGSRNICTVPLTSFVCDRPGFRSTLLERNDETFDTIYRAIADAIREFLASD